MKKQYLLTLALLMAAASPGSAQQPQLDANRPLTLPTRSPDVHADRTVTFRISAPGSSGVKLAIDGKTTDMTRDDKGVWSAKIGPLAPDFYNYNYEIDGARVSPVSGEQGSAAMFEVTGDPAPAWATRDVPHGPVLLMNYYSEVQKWRRRMRVYLPPQYFTEPNRRFPVLYLFMGGNETVWTERMQANLILDNLIADKKAVPMIVVMPDNSINDGTGHAASFPPALDNLAIIQKETQTEIMPMVERSFRTIADRDHRAITGFSFGGGVAFGMGMRRLEQFGWIGEFSTGAFGGADTPPAGHTNYIPYDAEKIAPGIYKRLVDPKTKPQLFYMAVGERDPRAPHQRAAYEDFRKRNIDVIFRTVPGGHDDTASRSTLTGFLPLLFK